ncbi:hypothetical protein MN086_06415 [Sulfurovum sp. XGS-02]|uniref:hypothetical protein n=1 Tax=Sulfurovum sp. XGS-02 TaxID=2925411 RepID=UPI00204D96AA|nr:hypothetical protein [Sulfurovum sp. XGS-02]UPT76686.1 hypothetical protein MN086_06415 [Sulfurovum sp. XGS-02]
MKRIIAILIKKVQELFQNDIFILQLIKFFKRIIVSYNMMVDKKRIFYFKIKLLDWFQHNQRSFPWREANRSCYEIVIAEILLQRTKAETVKKYYQVFLNRFNSWESLAASTEVEIGEYLKPFGLWRQRSKRIKALAQEIERLHGLPKSKKQLEKLPIMGKYIVNTILTQCYGHKEAFVDVNMVRVLERFFRPGEKVDFRYDPFIQNLAKKIVYRQKHKETIFLNWAILDFSALVCKSKNPLCSKCPLYRKCNYYHLNTLDNS